MKIGYARVSTNAQNWDLQLDALQKEGCEQIFKEKISSFRERPEFKKMLSMLRPGDTLVVWKLDRLGRSLRELLQVVEILTNKGIKFKSIDDGINADTPLGRCQLGLLGTLAEYERAIMQERTKAGQEAARLRGRMPGRPAGLSPELAKKAKAIAAIYKQNEHSVNEICTMFSIGKASLYKCLRHEGIQIDSNNKEALKKKSGD